MNRFFDIDGPVYKWGTEIADFMILSILWLVCSIPIFTIGASTTALFYVLGKKVRKEDTYVFKPFFKSFKENFLQATIITVILAIVWFSSYLYYEILVSGKAQIWVKIMGLFSIIQVMIFTMYVFPILSRFHMTTKNLIMNSFILGNRHILSTALCGILFIGFIIMLTSLSPFSIFSFGLYALLSSFVFQRIFTKHIELVAKDNKKQAGK